AETVAGSAKFIEEEASPAMPGEPRPHEAGEGDNVVGEAEAMGGAVRGGPGAAMFDAFERDGDGVQGGPEAAVHVEAPGAGLGLGGGGGHCLKGHAGRG